MTSTTSSQETRGAVFAFIGVVMFAATLPATRLAVADLDPWWVALARAELAAALGALALWLTRQPRPRRADWAGLGITAAGVVLGFPLLTSIAMTGASAGRGAVVVGLLPFATAAASAFRNGERPSRAFWLCAGAASAVIVTWALHGTQVIPGWNDIALLAAVLAAAVGYAEGGRLARTLGGWQTIAWALVLSAPWLLLPALWLTHTLPLQHANLSAWIGFLYVTVFSQFIGFLFWYGGMAMTGVARASQMQLLQVFLTLIIAWALLDERIEPSTWLVAGFVVLLIWIGRRTSIRPAALPGTRAGP
jgi:drug/metabolite transporter (DMT)-like permease